MVLLGRAIPRISIVSRPQISDCEIDINLLGLRLIRVLPGHELKTPESLGHPSKISKGLVAITVLFQSYFWIYQIRLGLPSRASHLVFLIFIAVYIVSYQPR